MFLKILVNNIIYRDHKALGLCSSQHINIYIISQNLVPTKYQVLSRYLFNLKLKENLWK